MGGFLRELQLLRERVPDSDQYPYSIPALKTLESLALHPEVTFLIGENGSGKSTLVESIAILAGLNPEGGSKHFNFALRPTESSLSEALRLIRAPARERSAFFLRAETMFNLSTEIETSGLAEFGWDRLHDKSHGESFLWVVQNRFRPDGLYILDEPESALSPQRQLSLLRLIYDLVAQGSQFIIATHSPILMGYPDATIYELSEAGISPVHYEDTEHYLVTKAFLERKDMMLRELLGDDAA